ncbi:MAG TPA: lysophospholipid acyltransferase family protein [Bacteroidia bacterium]|nr:lysophospholipid acyltransferase family protein [Bacteroidia bacterium]
MHALLYYLSLPLIYLVSILPFPLLYGFSGIVYFVLYHMLGYRKKVVYQNLSRAFPEMGDAGIRRLRRKYFRYMCDLFLETFKTLTISRASMLRRCRMNPEGDQLLKKLYAENKHLILVLGHFGNWEWGGNTFSLTQQHQLYVIYHPLQNKYFNQLIIRMRTRFGTKLITRKDSLRRMLELRSGPPSATAFIADQTPHPDHAHWMRFMQQDTPVYPGAERFAKKLNYPVVYISVSRLKRGYYEINADLLFADPAVAAEFEITEAHTKRLEQDIRRLPATWLWSHKRWKHKRPSKINSRA